jgi:hypothetical protein
MTCLGQNRSKFGVIWQLIIPAIFGESRGSFTVVVIVEKNE